MISNRDLATTQCAGLSDMRNFEQERSKKDGQQMQGHVPETQGIRTDSTEDKINPQTSSVRGSGTKETVGDYLYPSQGV
jgi:hypothetical protein